MKLLPCSTRQCAPLGALCPPSRAYPNGEPAVSGQYVASVKCYRCKRPTEVPVVTWNRLPNLKLEDFQRLAQRANAPALAELPTRDFIRNGCTKPQAEDLFRAGFLDSMDAEGLREPMTVLVCDGAWHSPESDVYHDRKDCQTGDNINPRNIEAGKGGKRKCAECAKLARRKRG